ncbi:MAG: porin [Maricaulaceae bacterium]
MKNRLKLILLVGIATSFAPIAYSQTGSIEQRLQAMESQIAQLKAELAAEKAKGESDVIQLEQKIATPSAVTVSNQSSKSGFQVGDTTFKLGGFVDFDTHVSEFSDGGFAGGSVVRDFYIPGATPVGNGDNSTTTTDLTAESTRFSVTGSRNVGGKTATAYIETDFLLSGQGNERVSSSFAPRLRRAYIDYNGLRVGQEWSTFQNTSAIPESASFYTLGDGQVFVRQAQVRYTTGNFQFALENGNATITPAAGSGRIEADSNTVPDVVARYNYKGDFGNLSLAAIGRQLRFDTATTPSESDFGWGLSAAGRIGVGEGDLRFSLTGGEGLGRYIGLNSINAGAVNPLTGDVEAIPSYGGHVSLRYPLTEKSRFNIGVSALFADNPDFLPLTATENTQSVFAAYLFDIAPKVTVGFEGLLGERELENGTDGSLTRFTFSTKYGF